MDRKDKIIRLLEQAWELEQQFLNEQPPEERERLGTLEHWARKDVAAHIESWNEQLVGEIRSNWGGEVPARLEELDDQNKVFFERHQHKTWQEAFNFASQSREKMIDIVNELGADGLERTDMLPWQENLPIWRNIVGSGYSHALIHLGEHYRSLGQMNRYIELIEKLSTETVDVDNSPVWQGTVIYNSACVHALVGQKDKALEELGEALRLNPRLREWSRGDSDLVSLHGDPRFEGLFAEAG